MPASTPRPLPPAPPAAPPAAPPPSVETVISQSDATKLMVAGLITPLEASQAIQGTVTFDVEATMAALAARRVQAPPTTADDALRYAAPIVVSSPLIPIPDRVPSDARSDAPSDAPPPSAPSVPSAPVKRRYHRRTPEEIAADLAAKETAKEAATATRAERATRAGKKKGKGAQPFLPPKSAVALGTPCAALALASRAGADDVAQARWATGPDERAVQVRFERLALAKMPTFDPAWSFSDCQTWLLTLAEIAQMATPLPGAVGPGEGTGASDDVARDGGAP